MNSTKRPASIKHRYEKSTWYQISGAVVRVEFLLRTRKPGGSGLLHPVRRRDEQQGNRGVRSVCSEAEMHD